MHGTGQANTDSLAYPTKMRKLKPNAGEVIKKKKIKIF